MCEAVVGTGMPAKRRLLYMHTVYIRAKKLSDVGLEKPVVSACQRSGICKQWPKVGAERFGPIAVPHANNQGITQSPKAMPITVHSKITICKVTKPMACRLGNHCNWPLCN